MKYSQEQIEEAKNILKNSRNKDGKSIISFEKRKELNFIVTGEKIEHSPNEPSFSNCSFFNLKNMSCDWNGLNGIFNHEDYSRIYEFICDDRKFYFSGGDEFNNSFIVYENYLPKKLYLKCNYSNNKEIIMANCSLTNSQL